MNYFEIACQLCGVSFFIAHLRRADEAQEATWNLAGRDFVIATESDDEDAHYKGSCCVIPNCGFYQEHLFRPSSVSKAGYSGHRISLAKIQGCRTL